LSITVAARGVPASTASRAGGVRHVYRVERRKLAAQTAIRLLALVCALGPFLFVGILKIQSGSPSDTLYGVWVHSSGFAVSLVLLAFAGSWGLPLIAGIVAGDVFSSEDRYGTWKTVLTRGAGRRELFLGKLLAAVTFVVALVALTAACSLLAGVLVVGDQRLVSLSGTLFGAGHALALVVAAWAWCLVPTLAFTGLAVLLSVATRNGIVGVIGPGLATLVMQLLILVGTGVWAHQLLVAGAFGAWRPLLRAQPYYGPMLAGLGVSALWCAGCLSAAWLILRRRDVAGAPVARRQGWLVAVRTVAVLGALVALFAVAGNWGRAGVTAGRLEATLTPEFNNLTILQQQELGRPVPPGAKLNILPGCSRRGSTPSGPGDWVCTMNVIVPQAGAVPFQQTPVTYDVSVQPDGCFKAQSPPAFIGQQLMRDAAGHDVVNPLYTIYGCLNVLR